MAVPIEVFRVIFGKYDPKHSNVYIQSNEVFLHCFFVYTNFQFCVYFIGFYYRFLLSFSAAEKW